MGDPPRSSGPPGQRPPPASTRSSPSVLQPAPAIPRSSASTIQSSPSGMQRVPGADVPAKRRNQEVVQWLFQVRRAMEPFRQYSREHPLSAEALNRCVTIALELATAQELQLDVGPNQLHFDNHTVPFAVQGGAARTRDPLATTLFNEGVRRVTFLQTVTESEARTFLTEWIEAANQPLGGNVASKMWELEPKGLKLLLLDVFDGATEGGDGTGLSLTSGRGRSLSIAEQIDSLVSAISAEGLAADGGGGFVSQGLIQVSADDIELLRSKEVRSITAAELAEKEAAGVQSGFVEEKGLTALREELEGERVQAFSRLAYALLNAAVLNEDAHFPAILETYKLYVKGAFAAAAYEVPLQSWQRLVADSKSDPVFGARRVEVLKRFKAVLLSPEALAELCAGLDADATRNAALGALKVLGKAGVPAALKFASATRNEAARKEVLGFVREVDPSQMAAAAALDPTSIAALVARLPTMPDAEALDILEKLLSSLEVQSRRAGAKALTAKRAPMLRHQLLLARLQDNDSEVRMAMMKLVIALEDPSTKPALFSLAKRPRIEPPELELLYEAIAVLGGADAYAFLSGELNKGETHKKVSAALALGASHHPGVREVLESVAGKLLTPAPVKAACRKSIERLSKRGVPE